MSTYRHMWTKFSKICCLKSRGSKVVLLSHICDFSRQSRRNAAWIPPLSLPFSPVGSS